MSSRPATDAQAADEPQGPSLPRRADLRRGRARVQAAGEQEVDAERPLRRRHRRTATTPDDAAPSRSEEDGDGEGDGEGDREAQRAPAALTRRERRGGPGRRVAVVVGALAALVVVAGLVLGVVGVVAGGLVGGLVSDGDGEPLPASDPAAPQPAAALDEQTTVLLARADVDGGAATGAVLLAVDADGTATASFVPVSLLADVPGFGNGVELLNALRDGGPALLGATVANLLGIELDATAVTTGSALAALLERTGGLEVDVERRLVVREPDGDAVVRFEAGPQTLDGERLAEYLRFREPGETEVSTFVRQQQVVVALAEALRDPAVLDAVLADGAPQLEVAGDRDAVRRVLAGLADAAARSALQVPSLPVQPVGGAGDGGVTYVLPPAAREAFVEQHLAGSRTGGEEAATRVEVLNGVGRPGVGGDVAALLDGGGFRIERTENAASFDEERTLILVYDESAASLEAAEAVRDRLGVGTIQVSRQPQSVVELTIVVGADFQAGAGLASVPEPEQAT